MLLSSRSAALFLPALLLSPTVAPAGGFAVPDQGARAQGFGGAFTALADDPSALFHNAAGLAFLDGRQIYLGGTALAPRTTFAGADPSPGVTVSERTDTGLRVPPAAYYAHRFSERVVLGVAFNRPFELRTRWADADTYSGRFIAQLAELDGYAINPSVAWKAADRFAIGGGLDIRVSRLALERRVPARHPETEALVDAAQSRITSDDSVALGFNVGALARVSESLSFGVHYRHQVRHDFEGTGTFSLIPTGVPALDAAVVEALPLRPVAVRTSVALPALVTAGAAYRTGDWTAALDVGFARWSVFDRIVIDYDELPDLQEVLPQNYADTFQARAGAERRFGRDLAVRGGYFYERSPAPAASVGPLFPDSDRHGLSLGGSWALGAFRLDGAATYVFAPARSTGGASREGYDGTYKSRALKGALFVGYRF